MASNKKMYFDFKKYLREHLPNKCTTISGIEFRDTRVGDTFYVGFDFVMIGYAFSKDFYLNKGLDYFIWDVYRNENIFINNFLDRYKIISKYEKVENFNPFNKKKYHLYKRLLIKNLSTKEVIQIKNLDLVYFFYFDKLQWLEYK